MPYAPTVNDRSGEILGAYTASAANTRAEGMQNFGQSIGEGLAAMGSGIGGGISQAGQQAIKYKTAAGMLDAYRTNADAFGFDMNTLDAMEQKYAKDPDKLLGALTVLGEIGNNNMSMQRQQANIDGYKDLYDYKAANTAATAPEAPKLDAQYGREFYMGLRNNNRSHEQALQDMKNAGLNWAIPYIDRPQNQGFFGTMAAPTNPNPTGP